MTFDPEKFGAAMGEAIRAAVEPLQKQVLSLQKQLTELGTPRDGKDGADGKDGQNCDMDAVKNMVAQAVSAIPAPKNGVDGKDGADGRDGSTGEKGADGAGIADLLTDRSGALVATFTDGRMKNLGVIIGKDGADGKDGVDGVGLEQFDLEYLTDTHEICLKAVCAGRIKEVRFPAGGIHGKGYWREGVKANAGEAWVHDGSLWVAKIATTTKPAASDQWFLAARKGRDGERGAKGQDALQPSPISLEKRNG